MKTKTLTVRLKNEVFNNTYSNFAFSWFFINADSAATPITKVDSIIKITTKIDVLTFFI